MNQLYTSVQMGRELIRRRVRSPLTKLLLAAATLGSTFSQAQSPGGVSANLRVWLRSDNGFTPASWTDGSGNANHYTQTNASRQPFVAADYYNFNPVVDFGTSGSDARFMVVPAGKPYSANGTSSSVFTVNLDRAVGGYGDILGFGATTTTASLINANSPVFTRLGTNVVNYPYADASPALPAVQVNKLYINDVSFTVGSAGIKYGQNGTTGSNTQTFAAVYSRHADGSVLGSQPEVRNGLIGEVIAYERDLSEAEKQRVRTYTAIKYGITLPHNYIASNGSTIIWNQATNTGYNNNIAGIARDENGALHQKQSRSINDGRQVLIGTAGLANTNVLNTTGLTDGQFLVWGDNGLAKTPSVTATNLGADVNARFASIWKVQNVGTGTVRVAWPKGFDNLKLIQSGDAVIDGSDVVTAMSAETAPINGIVYNYVDVTLATGTYFTFAAKVGAPGGVSGPVVWLKANEGTTVAGSSVSGWANYGISGGVAGQLGRTSTLNWALPKYGANEHNFNPAIVDDVPGTNDGSLLLADVFPASGQRALSSFVLHSRDNVSSSENNMIAFTPLKMTSGALEAPYMAGYRGNRPWVYWQDVYENAPTLPNSVTRINNIPSVNGFYIPQWVSGTQHQTTMSMNGATTTTGSYSINPTSRPFGNQLFIFGDGNANNWSGGKISEVITYDKLLTDTEKLQVNSYLSIKYGITLTNNAGTAVPNYLNSAAAVVWDATANTGYNKNIAGIANDAASTLNQKQSKSVNTGQQVLIATTGLTDANATNGTALTDGQYLIWGDNGLSRSLGIPHVATIGGVDVNLRFSAIWKVQSTGSTGTVRVAWPSGVTSLHLVQSTDASFDASDSHTAMSSTTVVNGVAYNYADVTLSNGSYFTFAGFIAGPGGVGTDLSLWYRADNGVATDASSKVTEWQSTTTNAVTLTPNSAAYIPYNDQTAFTKTWNFNPTVTFDGTNNYLRNTTTNYLNTAGSVHYFSVANLRKLNVTYRNMFSISGNDDGFFLQISGQTVTPMPTINNYVSPSSTGPVATSRLGIFSSILPKSGVTPNQRGYFNGLEKIYTAAYPRTGGNYTLPTSGAYLGADGTTGDNFFGEIAEVVVFHNPAGGDMLAADINRIHSYLAIKYGITLDQTTAQNYVNSSNSNIWTAANNVGYDKNIAGIGRDDQGALYQKQSSSVNPGRQVLVSTVGLSSTNVGNASQLNNNQFLVWGDNGLAKGPSVPITGIPNVNQRFAAVWKVQNTASIGTVRVAWPSGLSYLKLIQSSDDVFSSSDVTTDMTATQVVNGIEYAYADVTLTDGEYFTFAAFVQGPGGVTTNLSYWYRADKLVDAGSEGSDVGHWTDFTSGTTISQLSDNDLPKYKNGNATYFNFNPGINYTAGEQSLANLNVQTVTALNFDIYTLTKEGLASGGSNPRLFSSLVDNVTTTGSVWHWDAIGLNIVTGNSIERVNTARNNRYMANPGSIAYSSTHPSIMYQTYTDLTAAKGLNGAANGTTGTYASARGQMTGGHAIGSTEFSGNGSDNAGFIGNIGELIIYGSGNNTAAERNKVESYLGIKYGVTLANTNNYTTSQNVVVWDATANSGYYNNVAGIGSDFVSALEQKQSRSQHANTNNQVTIGLGEIAETNLANTNTLNNGQYLVWGDNGNTQAMTNTASTYTSFTYAGSASNGRRMNRVWKVQNTNNLSNDVLIRFPIASVGTTAFATSDACGDYVIIFADDATFTTNVTVQALTVNGTDYDVAHNFPNGASYFTYGKVIPFNQGVVYLPATTETTNTSTNACDVGTWKYFRKTADNTQKLMGITGYTNPELANLTVTITPLGASYDDGTRKTNLMQRITTVTNSGSSPLSVGKVRIYYSLPEKNATAVPSEQSFGWYKYEGTADEVIANVYASGTLDPAKTTALTPNATGVEDGVSYVEFHNVTSFSSFVYLSSTLDNPLPVTLTYFNAAKEESVASLKWGTTQEVNNRGFEIQRSADARNWHEIGFVDNQTGGNSKGALSYNFTDATPLSGTNYYRLKQIDWDDTFRYSSIAAVKFEGDKGSLFVYPNPVVNGSLSLNLPRSGSHKVSVLSISGLEVLSLRNSGATLDVKSLPSGVYVLKVVYEGGDVYSKTFVVK